MKIFLYFLLLLPVTLVYGQDTDISALHSELSKADNDIEKVKGLKEIMSYYNGTGKKDSAKHYLTEILTIAEESSESAAKIEAFFAAGIYWNEDASATRKERLEKGREYFSRALEICRSSKDIIREAWAHYNLSIIWMNGEFQNNEMLDEAQKALNIALEHPDDDSLYIYSYIRTAHAYIQSQRNYEQALNCLDKAVIKTIETGDLIRLRSVYKALSDTYDGVNDRAKQREYIDKMAEVTKRDYRVDWAIEDMYMKGNSDRNEDLFDLNFRNLLLNIPRINNLNREYWERSTALLEKAYKLLSSSNSPIIWKFDRLHARLFWNYFWLNKPEKIIELRNLDTTLYRTWEKRYKRRNYIFKGAEFYLANQPDSTLVCLDSVHGRFETMEYYLIYFLATLKKGNTDSLVPILERAKVYSGKFEPPKTTQSIILSLDSLYRRKGDLKKSNAYLQEYILLGDSLNKTNNEKILWALQLSNREKVIQKEKEMESKAINRRHSLQYLGIVLGIVIVFILLALMGLYRVPTRMVRIVGFFSFLLFFEFLFLVFKKQFEFLTHGEPLRELIIMILLAGVLVPLHHWLEHKVIYFLTSQQMVKLRKVFSKKEVEQVS